MKTAVTAVVICTYPQQGAGGVDGCFGKQLAGKVEVSFGLNVRQRDCGNSGEECLAGCPGSKLLHSTTIVLVEVEGAAGGPRLHVSANCPVKCHHRETKGVDQHDGVIKELCLCREMCCHLSPISST